MNSAMKARSMLAALLLAATAASGAMAQDKISVTTEAAVAASEVPADAIVVEIDKLKYQTPDLTVKVGDTVYWVNKEAMPHNVEFVKGVVNEGGLKGPMLKRDEAYSITFNEAGSFNYHCTPHPFMRGKVTVE